ncbi:Hypothetical protein PHPALM_20178 [Phytophthora palmivora]|uniref:Uncharacterized protein n=1 Tax=Phytophthora palmivora TaxID=4796 RepID=A0A2P4XFJ6_9STRA|nr:Hypothetical protein PHPALM_20178 [Phytophthora palmivora]
MSAKVQVKTKEQVKGLGRFVEATEKAFAILETTAAHKAYTVVLHCCSQVTTKLLDLIRSDGKVEEATACLYRDTTVRMGVLLSEKRAVEKLELKSTIKAMNQLGQLIKASCTKDGVPTALSDPALQCTWLDLKHFIDSHRDDALLRMHEYVIAFQQQNKQGSLVKLLGDFLDEMISYRKRKAPGPLRSEENWNIFAEVGEVLADWIGSTTVLNVKESKRMRSMFHELKIFDATFPDRVPPYLFHLGQHPDYM